MFDLCGYNAFYQPDNQSADSSGRIYEHRKIAQQIIGKRLQKEVVHHKDKNRKNNSIQNLMVFASNQDHAIFHNENCNENILYMDENNIYHVKPQYVVQYRCLQCGSIISKGSTRCAKCNYIQMRKVDRPNKNELNELIKQKSFVDIGKMYGVSDNAIKKWCVQYGLPYKKRDIKSKS